MGGDDTIQKKGIRNEMKEMALEAACEGRDACARAAHEAQDTRNTAPDGRYGLTPIKHPLC